MLGSLIAVIKQYLLPWSLLGLIFSIIYTIILTGISIKIQKIEWLIITLQDDILLGHITLQETENRYLEYCKEFRNYYLTMWYIRKNVPLNERVSYKSNKQGQKLLEERFKDFRIRNKKQNSGS